MFTSYKSTFGQTAAGFGGFNTTASPFGQSTFGKPANTGFGSGAFGAAQPQPGQTGGLFGQQPAAQPSTGLFGQPPQTTNAFGAATTQTGFGFGQNQPAGLFSTPANTGTSLFGQPATQPFGAKPQGFGFGTASSSGGLFGTAAPTSTGLFGQSTAATPGTSGLFGTSAVAGFGAQQTGTYLKYAPVTGSDVMVKNGQSQNINTLHHCITCMKEYESKSLEELRLEDYSCNRRGGTTALGATGGGVFGQGQPQGGLFGQSTNTFGQPNTAFGQPSTSTTGGLFGKPATTGFGQPATGTGFSFGASTSNQSTGLFGAPKSFSGGLIGAPATQAQPTPFSSQPSQGFGTMGAPQQSGNLFGAKPPENTGFGLGQNTQANTGFGAGSVFGAPASTAASGGLFGAKPGTTPFGSAAPAFGSTGSAFGATTSNTTGGGLFGNTSFGPKPATSGAPAFGAFNPSSTANTGIGGGLNLGGGSLFGQKPGGTGLFGNTGTAPQTGGLFGNTGGGLQLGGGGFGTGTNTFGSGTTNFNTGGLNAGGLGTTSGLTGFGGSNLFGNSGNSLQLGNTNTSLNAQSPPSGNIHEQMMALVSKPFGHSPLLKDLPASPDKVEDNLRPTNPIAQKAILESDKYKVSPGVPRLRVKPFSGATPLSKKSLFDGLEENDPSVQESFTTKRNVKRLVLRPKPSDNSLENSSLPAIEGGGNQSVSQLENAVTAIGDTSASDFNRSEDRLDRLDRDSPPANIQRRVGYSDPRGATIKSPLQTSSSANSPDVDSERRSSWLTTKSLNKWSSNAQTLENQPGTSASRMPANIGSSVATTSVVSQLDSTIDQLLPGKSTGSGKLYPSLKKQGLIGDVETLDDDTQEERDKENTVPHPTGIKLTRPGYYTIPSMEELIGYIRPDGSCVVPQFTIGRRGYGNVFFDCEIDVANLDLDEIVHIMNKEIIVYPEDDNKPEVGKGLNRKAQVTLDKVWPKDKTFMVPITDPERLALMDYEAKLRRACDKIGTKFIEYRPQTGSWVFKVQHFSKYGLTESDEEDEGPADIQKMKQLQQQHGNSGVNSKPPGLGLPVDRVGRGLGGGEQPVGLGVGRNSHYDDEQSLDEHLFMGRAPTSNKGLAMDTSEENSVDTIVFYPEGNASESKDVLSPVSHSHLTRNSHTLQLMKASFYNMDNDDAVSLSDQLVPQVASTAGSVSNMSTRLHETAYQTHPMDSSTLLVQDGVTHEPFLHSGVEMKAPIVKPQTVMLKFHKQVLPFHKTIAGKMGASPYTDLSIANARLFRVGWGKGSQLTSLSTLDATTDAVLSSSLPTLHEYLKGRLCSDASPVITQRLRVGGGGAPVDMSLSFKESIEPHLEITLKNSKLVYPSGDDTCPLIMPDPDKCLLAAKQHLQEDSRLSHKGTSCNFGASPGYWKQVWSLCLALWDEHLNDDIDPDVPNGERLLADHAALSAWFEEVNGQGCEGSRDIVSLLSANKIGEACVQCQSEKNYIAAAILTQIKGDLNIRSLAYNQLATWRETSSDNHVPPWFLSILALCSGRACALIDDKGTLLHTCEGLSWTQALALHYWYLCDPIATVPDALVAYQRSFWEDTKRFSTARSGDIDRENEDAEMEDGSQSREMLYAQQIDIDKSRVAYPFPPYTSEAREETNKQMLDLRFQLLCLKASRWTSLDSIINPASHTPDPLDYRLSWCLQQFLEGLGYSHWSQSGMSCLITGFAAQLEAHGMWPWALFVLQHITNHNLRNTSVKEILMRHAGNMEIPFVKNHLERLGIPGKWIHQAEAQLARYRNDPESEAKHLTLAERYVEAHQVILNKLAPTYILNENAELLRRVLEPLIKPGKQGVIPHWNSGGHLFLEFMDIWDEVKSLVGLDWNEFSYKCEILKKRIASACTAISGLATPTLKHTVARWEVAARLAQVGCAVVGDPDTGRVNKSSVRPLLSIISALDLPPDYTRLQLDKFIKSFTEEATF